MNDLSNYWRLLILGGRGQSGIQITFDRDYLLPIGKNLDFNREEDPVLIVPGGNIDLEELVDLLPSSARELMSWIDDGFCQYLGNILPDRFEDRVEEYLINMVRFRASNRYCKSDVIEIVANRGISEFLIVNELFVFWENGQNAVVVDFSCPVDEYLDEYGFCLIVKNGNVEFIIRDVLSDFHLKYCAR